VRVVAYLREIRAQADLTLTEVEETTGISRGTLSQLETGQRFPADKHVGELERVYGPRADWYPKEVLVLIQNDRGGDG